MVGTVEVPDLCPGLQPGDVISKLNGRTVGDLSHTVLVNHIKMLRRPIIIHFVQAFSKTHQGDSCTDDESFKMLEKGKPLPSFSGDKYVHHSFE